MPVNIVKFLKLFVIVLLVVMVLLFLKKKGDSPFQISRNRTAVVTQIQQLNKLETSVFSVEKIIDARTSGNAFQRLLFGDNLLLIAHGKVVAGVDLSKLSEEQIQISNRSVTITLPNSEIFHSALDESRTEVYHRTRGLLTKGDNDLESEARKAAEMEILQAACQSGILVEAADSAKVQMTNLLEALGFSSVTVIAEAGTC